MTTASYQPPGVSVSEVVTPQVSPILSDPTDICLVGMSQGYQTRTDQFVLSGTTAILLPGLAILPGSAVIAVLSIKDATNPSKGASDGSGYTLTTDYTVSTSAGTVTRVGAGVIADPTLVNVTYTYLPANYFIPILLYDLASVESRFGSAIDATGTKINSPLSFAAGITFENGASSVVCQPLFARATPGDATTNQVQPTGAALAATTTWTDTLAGLRGLDDLNVIVPIVGQFTPASGDPTPAISDSQILAIYTTVQDHLAFQNGNRQYIMAIFGEDSSTDITKATETVLQTTHASTLAGRYGGSLAEQIVLLNTSRFLRAFPSANASVSIGGQYMAAAIAGMLAARPISQAITRAVTSGFIGMLENRTLQQKATDAQAGLLVLEAKSGVVQVRHGITLDTSQPARQEISVVRAKFRVIESVTVTLENQIIGQIIADANSPFVVRSTVVGVLEALRSARNIVDYSAVDARLLTVNPTTIEVRFSYRPAFPLNYIKVVFSLDLTTQDVRATVTT